MAATDAVQLTDPPRRGTPATRRARRLRPGRSTRCASDLPAPRAQRPHSRRPWHRPPAAPSRSLPPRPGASGSRRRRRRRVSPAPTARRAHRPMRPATRRPFRRRPRQQSRTPRRPASPTPCLRAAGAVGVSRRSRRMASSWLRRPCRQHTSPAATRKPPPPDRRPGESAPLGRPRRSRGQAAGECRLGGRCVRGRHGLAYTLWAQRHAGRTDTARTRAHAPVGAQGCAGRSGRRQRRGPAGRRVSVRE